MGDQEMDTAPPLLKVLVEALRAFHPWTPRCFSPIFSSHPTLVHMAFCVFVQSDTSAALEGIAPAWLLRKATTKGSQLTSASDADLQTDEEPDWLAHEYSEVVLHHHQGEDAEPEEPEQPEEPDDEAQEFEDAEFEEEDAMRPRLPRSLSSMVKDEVVTAGQVATAKAVGFLARIRAAVALLSGADAAVVKEQTQKATDADELVRSGMAKATALTAVFAERAGTATKETLATWRAEPLAFWLLLVSVGFLIRAVPMLLSPMAGEPISQLRSTASETAPTGTAAARRVQNACSYLSVAVDTLSDYAVQAGSAVSGGVAASVAAAFDLDLGEGGMQVPPDASPSLSSDGAAVHALGAYQIRSLGASYASLGLLGGALYLSEDRSARQLAGQTFAVWSAMQLFALVASPPPVGYWALFRSICMHVVVLVVTVACLLDADRRATPSTPSAWEQWKDSLDAAETQPGQTEAAPAERSAPRRLMPSKSGGAPTGPSQSSAPRRLVPDKAAGPPPVESPLGETSEPREAELGGETSLSKMIPQGLELKRGLTVHQMSGQL